MNGIDKFIKMVRAVCGHPNAFVRGGSFDAVCAYITGYAHGSPDCPLSGEGSSAFNDFVCAACRFPDKYHWYGVLKQSSHDEDEATAKLQNLLTEFAERTRTETHAEIVQEVQSRARCEDEGEPIQTWRRFSRAIHRARREEVEPLIQNHADADVLWSANYPDEVAPLLDEIQESCFVSQIAGSEADGEVTIITPDFGPVGVKRIDGRWRVDASKIINCWKDKRAGNQSGS